MSGLGARQERWLAAVVAFSPEPSGHPACCGVMMKKRMILTNFNNDGKASRVNIIMVWLMILMITVMSIQTLATVLVSGMARP